MPIPRQPRPRRKEIFALDLVKQGKAQLYSEATGRPSSLSPNIRSIAWSPTGGLIATCLSAHIRVWNPDKPNVRSSTELRNAGGLSVVEKLEFCPTHEAVLASTGADGMCRIWDVRQPGGAAVAGKGVKLAECKTGDAGLFLTWHPAGTEILVGRKDDVIQLVDVRKMNDQFSEGSWEASAQECAIEKDKGQFNAMAFSNSGKELYVTTGEGVIKILDWPSLQLLHTLGGHSGATNAVMQSPAGNFLAAGGNDSVVTLWDTSSWYCANAVTTHPASVRSLSFSFDGAYLVASSGMDARDGTPGLNVTHVETGEHVLTLETTNPVTWAAWHPLRYWLAYAGDPGGLKIIGPANTSNIIL